MDNVTSQKEKGILLEVGTNEVEFLLFQIGEQRYGINVAKVCQIVLLKERPVTPIPKQLPQVLGLTLFRDKSISVVDLAIHLAIPCAPETENGRLLLVSEFNGRTVGFVIDTVDRIERCSWGAFKPTSESLPNSAENCVVGTISLKDGTVVILDVETIMGTIDPSMSVQHYEGRIPQSPKDRSAVRIVYCEDSQIVQKTLVKTLHGAGFRKIETFPTGLECLEYLKKAQRDQVDIILSDIEMPSMDGLTLCKRLREDPKWVEIPVIFFSSMINDQMKRKCESVGGNASMSKPEIHLVVGAIDEFLSLNK